MIKKTQIIFLILATIFFGCVSCNVKSKESKMREKQHLDSSFVTLNMLSIIHNISSDSNVYAKYTGYAGATSNQYLEFERLKKFASLNDLVNLTNSKSISLKVYAFLALNDKENNNIKAILEKHLKDKDSFTFFSGCIGTQEHVNVFFYKNISNQLSNKERETYMSEISKCFTTNEWKMMSRWIL
jgi:hypothetical protein